MRLIFTDPAKKDYKSLAKEMRDRAQSALNRMLLHPEACDLIRIKGEPDKWRLRVGDWRVIMRAKPSGQRFKGAWHTIPGNTTLLHAQEIQF